ncbi:MAG TPA: hypothetical protein VFZ37_09465 [Jiangellaceae bacterium]
MLALTAEAVLVIREITVQTSRPADTGIRISTTAAQGNGVPALDVQLAEQPEPLDQVVETDGARVFLDPDASVVLADKWLDATVHDGRAQFLIAEDHE